MRKILLAATTLSLFALLTPRTALAGFGISPAQIYYEYLKPGVSVTQDIMLSRSDIEEELIVTIEPDLAEMDSWFKFDPGKKFTFLKGERRKPLKVNISIPKDAPYKTYSGALRIKTTTTEEEAVPGGVSIIKGARMEVKLVTTELNVNLLNVRSLKLLDLTTDSNGQGTLILKTNIENSGNVPTAPSKAVVEITDLLNKPIATIENEGKMDAIPPAQVKEIEAKFKVKLAPGEYFGHTKILLGDKVLRSDRLVFFVTAPPPGSEAAQAKPILFTQKYSLKQILLLTFWIILVTAAAIYTWTKTRLNHLIIIVISLVAVSAGLFGIRIFSRTSTSDQKPAAAVTPTPEPTGAVKGEQTEKTISGRLFAPLIVNEDAPVSYKIFRFPDLESEVIGVAQEDQQFFVLEESSQWYRVVLSDDTDGWLPKSNIKSAEVQEGE